MMYVSVSANTPFTRYNRFDNRLIFAINICIFARAKAYLFTKRHRDPSSRFSLATIHERHRQTVWLNDVQRFNWLSKRFDDRFDNRLYRVNVISQCTYTARDLLKMSRQPVCLARGRRTRMPETSAPTSTTAAALCRVARCIDATVPMLMPYRMMVSGSTL